MTTHAARGRHRARETAFRVVYQADLTHDRYAAVWSARAGEEKLGADGIALVEDVVRTLEARGDEVDAHLKEAAAHWTLERLSATDRSVLRAAIAELLGRPGTPARVVIDEAIEIAKRYGSDESGRFVNGVLDPVVRRLRPKELA